MSSDSEDDCYGNIAQRLQSMKNKYSDDKIKTTNLLIADLKEKTDNSWRKNDSLTSEKDCNRSQNNEDYSLDAIIAKNSTKRATRSSKRAAKSTDNILEKPAPKKKSINTTQSDMNTTNADPSTINSTNNVSSVINTSNNHSMTEETSSTRGRGRRRGRATPRRGRGRQPTIPEITNTVNTSNTRGRSPGRTRGCRVPQGYRLADHMQDPALFDFAAALTASMAMVTNGPVYSVGNTDEYPDQSDDQPLFNAPKTSKVVVVEEEELDENEELSVKVYWQSTEHVKFNIRRFQKLSKIFDYFAERENVSRDKLFFTYNDKILKSDDTPDSISYSIVKFIDGGVVNQSVASIVKNDSKDNGIKLKFQCQNVKKPFVLSIQPKDKMSVAMMKCAEHLEMPLEKLKFHFDGDLVSGNYVNVRHKHRHMVQFCCCIILN